MTVDVHGEVSVQTDSAVRQTTGTARRWIVLPTTRLGWWAIRLAAVWMVIAIPVALVLYFIPGGQWVNAVVVYPLALAAAVGSGVLALAAMVRDRERAVAVVAALIPLLFLLVLLVLESSGVGPER